MRRTERARLLKTPPHVLTDPQLRDAAAYVLAERVEIGVERVHGLIRELRRRFGLTELEIAEMTGFRLYVVHTAMRHDPPPRFNLPTRPDR